VRESERERSGRVRKEERERERESARARASERERERERARLLIRKLLPLVCLHAPSLRAVVVAIARSLGRAARVDSFYLCCLECEDRKSKSERARERESERARERAS